MGYIKSTTRVMRTWGVSRFAYMYACINSTRDGQEQGELRPPFVCGIMPQSPTRGRDRKSKLGTRLRNNVSGRDEWKRSHARK